MLFKNNLDEDCSLIWIVKVYGREYGSASSAYTITDNDDLKRIVVKNNNNTVIHKILNVYPLQNYFKNVIWKHKFEVQLKFDVRVRNFQNLCSRREVTGTEIMLFWIVVIYGTI